MRHSWPPSTTVFGLLVTALLLISVGASADVSPPPTGDADLSQDFLEFLAEFGNEQGQIDLPDTDTVDLVNEQQTSESPDDKQSQDELQRRVKP